MNTTKKKICIFHLPDDITTPLVDNFCKELQLKYQIIIEQTTSNPIVDARSIMVIVISNSIKYLIIINNSIFGILTMSYQLFFKSSINLITNYFDSNFMVKSDSDYRIISSGVNNDIVVSKASNRGSEIINLLHIEVNAKGKLLSTGDILSFVHLINTYKNSENKGEIKDENKNEIKDENKSENKDESDNENDYESDETITSQLKFNLRHLTNNDFL